MIKRLFDIFFSGLALLILALPLTLLAWRVRCKLGSPVLFTQLRPGLKGKPFKMIKFRSMTHTCDGEGNLLTDAERLTPFGRWLRATSLDELPELWNVICGDMSLVGPRPLAMQYLPLYSPRQFKRHDVRPGITGWAQVNGRDNLSWSEKFELDLWYVENQCISLDMVIIVKTVASVFARRDIIVDGQSAKESFNGFN